jgi:hypothetical protein
METLYGEGGSGGCGKKIPERSESMMDEVDEEVTARPERHDSN